MYQFLIYSNKTNKLPKKMKLPIQKIGIKNLINPKETLKYFDEFIEYIENNNIKISNKDDVRSQLLKQLVKIGV